jgi:hypothetical protein
LFPLLGTILFFPPRTILISPGISFGHLPLLLTLIFPAKHQTKC